MRVMLAGNEVRRHREALGLTQEALAHRAGLSLRTIQRIERETYARSDPATAVALARVFGLGDPLPLIDDDAAIDGVAP